MNTLAFGLLVAVEMIQRTCVKFKYYVDYDCCLRVSL